jgi:hypothetical protein
MAIIPVKSVVNWYHCYRKLTETNGKSGCSNTKTIHYSKYQFAILLFTGSFVTTGCNTQVDPGKKQLTLLLMRKEN